MNPIEDYQDVLQNIESAVVHTWRTHSEMTNYSVMRVYDAAIAFYNALAREQTPKPANLTGLDADLLKAVQEICEFRLGRVKLSDKVEVTPIPLEDLVACLRKLRKSVDFWTKQGGRQGYLQYIEKFLP
jgi:hypothetical protein